MSQNEPRAEPPKLKRMNTSLLQELHCQYNEGYEKALEKVNKTINKNLFKPEAFFIGVVNYTVTILLFAYLPAYYWIFHSVKGKS